MGVVLQGHFGGSAILSEMLAQKRRMEAAPAEPILPPGTRVHGIWGQGCGESEGIIVGLHSEDSGWSKRPSYWIVNEQGSRSAGELHQAGALSGIGWYPVAGGPLPGWESVVSGWEAAKAAKDAAAQAAKDAAAAKALSLITGWEVETPGLDCDGIMSAVSPDGAWRVWSRKAASAREFHPGDSIVVGSYNLTYFGTLTKATAKTIFFKQYGKPKKALARKLAFYNYKLDLEKEMARNANWSD